MSKSATTAFSDYKTICKRALAVNFKKDGVWIDEDAENAYNWLVAQTFDSRSLTDQLFDLYAKTIDNVYNNNGLARCNIGFRKKSRPAIKNELNTTRLIIIFLNFISLNPKS